MAQQLQVGFLDAPQNRASRRTVMLAPADHGLSPRGAHVVVHNISETGMLVLADPPLAIGDTLSLRLEDDRECFATVVRQDLHFAGCQFDRPVPKAWISAALLRSPIPEHGLSPADAVAGSQSANQNPHSSPYAGVSLIASFATVAWGLAGAASLLAAQAFGLG